MATAPRVRRRRPRKRRPEDGVAVLARDPGRWLNRLLLTAQIVERGALRYTPAGLPALDLGLRHESEVTQDGRPRKVSMEIRGRAIGDLTQRLAALEIGSSHGFAGFLGSQRNGRGIVFHVTELD